MNKYISSQMLRYYLLCGKVFGNAGLDAVVVVVFVASCREMDLPALDIGEGLRDIAKRP
jgi:hypothetical protein